jgi:hypothetical protein
MFFALAPVKTGGVAVAVALPPTGVVPVPVSPPTIVKLAQEIRVLFAKWKVIDRLPKKEPSPGRVDA